MAYSIQDLIKTIDPPKTILFFGAGSSIPSGAPSAANLAQSIRLKFGIENSSLGLADVASLAEKKSNRKDVIELVRAAFRSLHVTGGLSTLPLDEWKAIYTTNYDKLIEEAYSKSNRGLIVYASNFDFSKPFDPVSTKLYKLHGTIDQDISDGSHSRIILTNSDYDRAADYREFIFDKLAADISGSHLVIIGYSLADQMIKDIVDRAVGIQSKLHGAGGKVSLLLYERDLDRAMLFEDRGVDVYFGSIDEFFLNLAASHPDREQDTEVCENPIDQYPRLKAVTVDARHAAESFAPEFPRMYNGNPATHADVRAGLTFARDRAARIAQSLKNGSEFCLLLGASGVGKTTLARQVELTLLDDGWSVWEHRADFDLYVDDWHKVARNLADIEANGLLVIDDAHMQLSSISNLADALESDKLTNLKLLLVSSKHQWMPRYKSPVLNRKSSPFPLRKLSTGEIEKLLRLVDHNDEIRPLIEDSFAGYTFNERRRRLSERCSADMFVCLKNIFATEKFDDIIVREFNGVEDKYRDIYRIVAAMEHAGIRVHRQLVVRLLQIPADAINEILRHLDELVIEYEVAPRDAIYGWRVRHPVIAGIISKYKLGGAGELIKLFERVIDSISPAYPIEVRTLVEICNVETGIPSIADKREQNRLLRKMISMAPGERVPRHRLIRNLIELGEFDEAETEVRLFRKDLGKDGPLARYQIDLLTARAKETPGLLEDDRLTILREASELAQASVAKYNGNRTVHIANCEVALAWFELTDDFSPFTEAVERFKEAEQKFADPEMTAAIRWIERKAANVQSSLERQKSKQQTA